MLRLIAIKFFLTLFTSVLYLPAFLNSYFLKKQEREYFFRVFYTEIVRLTVRLARIKVVTLNNFFLNHSTIFVSKQSSVLDRLLLQALLGPDVISIIPPIKHFSFITRWWLQGMGAIDVVKDKSEHELYPESNTKYQALHKALKVLKNKHSLLVFFENSSNLMEDFYLPHTGVVHLSYASQSAIQTMTIKNTRKQFFLEKKEVTVEFRKCYLPEAGYGEHTLLTTNHKLQENIKIRTMEIKNELLK